MALVMILNWHLNTMLYDVVRVNIIAQFNQYVLQTGGVCISRCKSLIYGGVSTALEGCANCARPVRPCRVLT